MSLLLVLGALSNVHAQDTIRPAPPEIACVSVDSATGDAVIYWDASTSPNVVGYTMYYDTTDALGQTYFISSYDTVPADVRQWTYTEADPSRCSRSFTVAALNSIGNISPLPEGHSTVHLSIQHDSCTKSMILNWSSYRGWDVFFYDLYCSIDNGPFSMLVPGSTQDTTAVHLNIEENRQYCYFVVAQKGDNTISLSNIACRNVTHPLYPAWINAESASAVGDDRVEVKFALDPAGEVSSYQLYKAAGPGKPFLENAIIREDSDTLVYQDPVVSTRLQYQYKLFALDVCDHINPETESNICGNIVLIAKSIGLEGFLSWTSYAEYEAGVENYLVYRKFQNEDFVLIDAVSAPDTSYQDDLSFFSWQQIEDEICYRVDAQEYETYTRGERGISRSNVSCISVVPEIRMANAIIPNSTIGKNTEIGPVLRFIPRYFLFQVFDRWGSKIFETTNHQEKWDGRAKKGPYVPEGVYVYFIRLTTSSGIEVEKTGEITVFYK